MTEQEAIEWIKKIYIDTNQSDRCISLKMAISALMEIQQYHAIGTVEECQEAMEKQQPKSPDVWGDGYSDGEMVYDMYDCPGCGESYEIDGGKYNFCPNCGQALDWSA